MPSHYLNIIRNRVSENLPFQSSFFDESLAGLNAEEMKALEDLITFYVSRGNTPEHLADCYQTVVEDTISEQIFFKKNGRYRFSTYEEVQKSDFYTSEYSEKYFKGLALTQYFWPNHRQLFSFFRNNLPRQNKGKYLEIGPGHGLFMAEALKTTSFDRFIALDVHPTSLKLTREILNDERVRYVSQDILQWETEERYEAIVMGEVLEHTEKPEAILKKIRQLIRDEGFIYLSTCMNTPARDHLTLFRSADEVRRLIKRSGLMISQEILIPYFQKSIEESVRDSLPMNIGFILNHGH